MSVLHGIREGILAAFVGLFDRLRKLGCPETWWPR